MSDDRDREFEWIKRMIALEEELGSIPPNGFGGGVARRRVVMASYSSPVDANGSPAEEGAENDGNENDLSRRS